jgi:hypothetical protein
VGTLNESLYEIFDTNGILAVQENYAVTDHAKEYNLKTVNPTLFYKTANLMKEGCPSTILEINKINPEMKAGWKENLN